MFKDKLKELREKEGLSQQELADKLFVSRSAVAKWENGNGIPSDVNLDAICKIFNVEEEWILSRSELKKITKKNENINKIIKYLTIILIINIIIKFIDCLLLNNDIITMSNFFDRLIVLPILLILASILVIFAICYKYVSPKKEKLLVLSDFIISIFSSIISSLTFLFIFIFTSFFRMTLMSEDLQWFLLIAGIDLLISFLLTFVLIMIIKIIRLKIK